MRESSLFPIDGRCEFRWFRLKEKVLPLEKRQLKCSQDHCNKQKNSDLNGSMNGVFQILAYIFEEKHRKNPKKNTLPDD